METLNSESSETEEGESKVKSMAPTVLIAVRIRKNEKIVLVEYIN